MENWNKQKGNDFVKEVQPLIEKLNQLIIKYEIADPRKTLSFAFIENNSKLAMVIDMDLINPKELNKRIEELKSI